MTISIHAERARFQSTTATQRLFYVYEQRVDYMFDVLPGVAMCSGSTIQESTVNFRTLCLSTKFEVRRAKWGYVWNFIEIMIFQIFDKL